MRARYQVWLLGLIAWLGFVLGGSGGDGVAPSAGRAAGWATGDRVRCLDGRTLAVAATRTVATNVAVYNFEVEDLHNDHVRARPNYQPPATNYDNDWGGVEWRVGHPRGGPRA